MPEPMPLADDIGRGSTVTPEWGHEVDYSDDGATRLRQVYDEPRYVLSIVWDTVTIEQAQDVETALHTYRMEQFSVTLFGLSYLVRLIDPPVSTYRAPDRRTVRAVFRGERIVDA